MPEEQPKFLEGQQIKYKFDKTTLKKIGKGMLIAGGGAVLTYLAEMIPQVDFGIYTAVAVGIFAVLINAAKEWIKGVQT